MTQPGADKLPGSKRPVFAAQSIEQPSCKRPQVVYPQVADRVAVKTERM